MDLRKELNEEDYERIKILFDRYIENPMDRKNNINILNEIYDISKKYGRKTAGYLYHIYSEIKSLEDKI